MNTENIKIENIEDNTTTNLHGLTKEEFNAIITSKIQTLDNLLEKNLITLEQYQHTKSRIYDLQFDS
tara:strand:+ start:947 stop:1147 length:201 start_codon:yes stop_codon:yes gene_type:complete